MTHGSRNRPDEQQQHRQQYELRPARDLDAHGRGRRHWSDGNALLAPHGSRAIWRWTVWDEQRGFDTLPRDMPSSRPNRRRRVERHQARTARRARRVALLIVLSAVFLVAIALTAFGSTTTPTSAIVPPKSLATVAQTRPTTEIVAQRGQVRLQLPISQSRLTAIGYHSTGDGALSLDPVGHQANEGLVSRVVHGIFGGGGGSPKWYQLAGERYRRRSTSAHRSAATSTRRWMGPWSRSGPSSSRGRPTAPRSTSSRRTLLRSSSR